MDSKEMEQEASHESNEADEDVVADTSAAAPSANVNIEQDTHQDGEGEHMMGGGDASSPPGVPPQTNVHVDQGERNDRPHSAISNEMADKLNRELALSNAHRLQAQGHWRKVLCKEKFQELRDEIPKLTQYHDESISRKKEVVDALQREITSLQELYQDAMVANMNRMEDLIAIHDDQVVKLETGFRDRVSSLQSQFRVNVAEISSQYDAEKETIRHAIHHQAEKDEAQINALGQEHQHELEEIKNRNLEHINSLRFIMDSRVEDLEEQFEQTHSEFAQNTDSTQAAYKQLKSKDEQMRKEIEMKTRQANKLQREIQRFQLIAKQEEAQIHERHQELLARKSRAIARWNMTQEEMTKFREEEQRKLVDLIRRANGRKDELRRQCDLAKRVKKIALACQKWESSREKFASLLRESSSPGEKHPGAEQESEHVSSSEQEEYDDDGEHITSIIGGLGPLGDTTHHFWNKYNMTKLDVLKLEKKVRQLKQREKNLKKKLKMYQDGITVNNDVLNERNPLFVINGKMNAMMPNNGNHPGGKKRVLRRLTVVDGNHFFATNNLTQVAS